MSPNEKLVNIGRGMALSHVALDTLEQLDEVLQELGVRTNFKKEIANIANKMIKAVNSLDQ